MEFMSASGINMGLELVPGAKIPFEEPPAWAALMEFAGSSQESAWQDLMNILEAAFAEDLFTDAVPVASLSQAKGFWHLREAVVEGQRLHGSQLKHDVAVPVANLPEFIQIATTKLLARVPGFAINPFGQAGDGNVHFNISTPDCRSRASLKDHRSGL